MTLKPFYSSHFVVWTQNTTYREGFSTFLSNSTLCQDWLCWFLYITSEPELHARYKRMHLDYFISWLYYLTKKNPKISKMAKSTFWLMKKPQDQIFRPKMWPKGWIWNLVTLLWWNPECFEKSQKSTFFYQNGFKIGQNVVLCLKFWIRPLKTNHFRL